MKSNIILILSVIILGTTYAHSDQDAFRSAYQLYQDGEFQKALDMYETIEKKSPVVWYNMGNAAYHADNQFQAMIYWQRAARSGSGCLSRDALYNCSLISGHHGTSRSAWFWISLIALRVPLWIWQLMAIVFFVFSMILGTFLYIRLTAVFVPMAFGLLVCLSACYVSFDFYAPRAIAIQESSVYAGPDEKFHVVDTLVAGRLIRVLDEAKEGWVKGSADSCTGWIKKDSIAVV